MPQDSFGRSIRYLRVSLDSRCDLHCAYCRKPGPSLRNPKGLKREQFARIIKTACNCGFSKIRLSGGEPLLYPELLELCSDISLEPSLKDLALSTNGTHLEALAKDLYKAGVKRLNISLDTLQAERYKKICGGNLSSVLKGIQSARSAGFNPLRINVVLMKGINSDEIKDFIRFSQEEALDLRFIELMPPALENLYPPQWCVPVDFVLQEYPGLKAEQRNPKEDSVARYYTESGKAGRIGLISSKSHSFCSLCNRLRLNSEGFLIPCLGSKKKIDLNPALSLEDSKALEALILQAVQSKPRCHQFNQGQSLADSMDHLGG